MGDGIAEDAILIGLLNINCVQFVCVQFVRVQLLPPVRLASIFSSRVNLNRVMTTHRSSLSLDNIFGGKRPNGAARRTMFKAAASRAGLPELRSTRAPPSFWYIVPSWKMGM